MAGQFKLVESNMIKGCDDQGLERKGKVRVTMLRAMTFVSQKDA